MIIEAADLSNERSLWPKLSRLQTTRTFASNMRWLTVLSQTNATLITAWEESNLLGCMVAIPCERLPTSAEYCAKIGIDPRTAILRSHIFVNPAYAKRGVSKAMRDKSTEIALSQGRTTRIVYGFETREILSWAKAQPGTTDTGLKDADDDPVLLAPLI